MILIGCQIILSSCGSNKFDGELTNNQDNSVVNNAVYKDKKQKRDFPQEGMTESIPEEYFLPANNKGKIISINYETEDYAFGSGILTKTAHVYLPFGYDQSNTRKKYNILYLMHGWGGDSGEFFLENRTNIYDNMIERGDIEPMIIVSPTFYSAGFNKDDHAASIVALRGFQNEFENALMPAVEGTVNTYTKSTSKKALKASRNHRAFGGFSFGSVTTWLQFCYNYDYIRYYMPMSGSCWYYGTYEDYQTKNNVDFLEELVKTQKLDKRGYFIYFATGTYDFEKMQSVDQMTEMLSRKTFDKEHLMCYQKDGGYHDYDSVMEFIYNGLPFFFKDY